jgi:hypothetical protein
LFVVLLITQRESVIALVGFAQAFIRTAEVLLEEVAPVTPETVVETLVVVAIYFVLKRLKRIIQTDANLYCGCETNPAQYRSHRARPYS